MAFKYYSTGAGLNYKRVLKHFQDQASGEKNTVILTGKKRNKNLILVDSLTDKNTTKNEEMPSLEVVDPVKRTVSQATSELRNSIIKEDETESGYHSSNRSDRKRKTTAGYEARKRTKRAKDVFNENGG